MTRILRSFFAGVLLAVCVAQGGHRHDVHDGGLSPAHVDCVLCAWSQKSHAPGLAAGGAGFAASFAAAPLAAFRAFVSPSNSFSLAFPRAPPAL